MSLTVEVPMRKLPDGRYFISDEDCFQYPWVREFVERFNNYWARDFHLCGYVSPLKEQGQ